MDSSPIVVVLNLAAAAALLIWAVRLVRTGFERAFGGQLRLWLRRSNTQMEHNDRTVGNYHSIAVNFSGLSLAKFVLLAFRNHWRPLG